VREDKRKKSRDG